MIMQNHPTSISKSSLKVLWCIHFRYNCRICRACSMQRAFNVPLRWWLPGRCGPTRKRPKSWPLTRRTPRSWFGWSELSSAGDFFISFKISDFQISSFSSFSFSDFLGSFVFFDHLQLLQSHNYITLYIYIIVSHLIYPDFRINHGALLAMLIGDKAFRCGFDRTSATAVELAAPVPGQPLRHSRRGAATHSSLLGKRTCGRKMRRNKVYYYMCVDTLWCELRFWSIFSTKPRSSAQP